MYAKYAVFRDKLGLNDLTVSKMSGVPQSTIYEWRQRSEKWKEGEKVPLLSAENLQKVATALGVKIEDLLEG